LVATAESYDPGEMTWSGAKPPAVPREDHSATPLSDGRTLVAGGRDGGGGLAGTAELYDPGS